MTKPALITIAINSFNGAWNDFLGPLLYIQNQEKYTLQIGLQVFQNQSTTQWNYLMAGATLVLLPTILLFFLAQRYFIEGMDLTGGSKDENKSYPQRLNQALLTGINWLPHLLVLQGMWLLYSLPLITSTTASRALIETLTELRNDGLEASSKARFQQAFHQQWTTRKGKTVCSVYSSCCFWRTALSLAVCSTRCFRSLVTR